MPQIIPPPGYTLEDEKKITPPPGYTLETVGLTPLLPHKTWDVQPPVAQPGMGKIVPSGKPMMGRFSTGVTPGQQMTPREVIEGAASTLSGFAAFPASVATKVGLMTPGAGKITLAPSVAGMAGNKVASAMTYKPSTQGGKDISEALGTIFKPIDMVIGGASKAVFPKDIEGQATVRTILETLLLASPYLMKYFKVKGATGEPVSTAPLKRLVEISKDVPAELKKSIADAIPDKIASPRVAVRATPEESALLEYLTKNGMTEEAGILSKKIADRINPSRLQSPPKPTGNPIADAKAQADFSAAQVAREAARPPSPGISVTPPAGLTTGVKVGEILPIKPANIQPINMNPAKVLADAIKQAPRLIPIQKSMFRKEAGERLAKAEEIGAPIGGEEGVKAAYAQMKGKMKYAEFDVPNIDPVNREALINMGWDNQYVTMGDRLSYWDGLRKMLDDKKFPAKHEIEIMNRILGNEVGDALLGRLSNTEQLAFWATNFANIPRTMMASFDLSAPLRQGIWLIGRPKQFARSLGVMFKSLKSEDGYNAAVQSMAAKPTFKLARERGLALTEINSALNKTEESFIGSGMIERMGASALKRWPGIRGKALNLIPEGVKVSQRAYTGFLNKLRADTFDSMVNIQKELGLYTDKQSGITDIFGVNEKLSTDTARYVNIATGRGTLSGIAKEHAALTNAVFFSPRLMSARFALFDPRTYFDIARIPRRVLGGKKYPFTNMEIIGKESVPKVSKFVRHEAIVDASKFVSFYLLSTSVAKIFMGQDIGANPRSSDFTKVISGNTSIDISGGTGSYVRTGFILAQQFLETLGITGESHIVSTTTGKKTKMGGGYNEVSFGKAFTRFFAQKENPIMSFLTMLGDQVGSDGKPINIKKELVNRILPMMGQDLWESYKDDPDALKTGIVGLLTLFGAGVQTYPPKLDPSFVDQTTKTRQEAFSGKPSGDRVINELKKYDVKAVLGTKKIGGEPVPEQDIQNVLNVAGEGIRLRVLMLMNSPAYAKQSEEKKKELLQRAVNAGWNAYKSKKKLGAK